MTPHHEKRIKLLALRQQLWALYGTGDDAETEDKIDAVRAEIEANSGGDGLLVSDRDSDLEPAFCAITGMPLLERDDTALVLRSALPEPLRQQGRDGEFRARAEAAVMRADLTADEKVEAIRQLIAQMRLPIP